MRVELLQATPVEVLAEVGSLPYATKNVTNGLVANIWRANHRSIGRHGMAVFSVEGVSQSLLRQLSRHPHINLMVKSTRYCNFEDTGYIEPPFLKDEDRVEFLKDITSAVINYSKWLDKDYTQEQKHEIAKLILPLGTTTNLIISGNYQALYEFLQLRVCARAEWEIRELARQLIDKLRTYIPEIFDNIGCRGDEYGYCTEIHRPCGKYLTKKQANKRYLKMSNAIEKLKVVDSSIVKDILEEFNLI